MNEQDLVATASSWCASHGVLMGARDETTRKPLLVGGYVYEPAPFSLYPTPFPRKAFDKAIQMAKPFNGVVHRGASSKWLQTAIATAAEGDKDFTGRLLELANQVLDKEANGTSRAQRVTLGILRSDYMLHGSADKFEDAIPLQVELNTIASSFGCLSTKVTRLHQHLNALDEKEHLSGDLPDNGAANGIAQGLAMACQEYNRQRQEDLSTNSSVVTTTVVVMVVQPGETNSCDQRDLEFLLQEKHGVRLIRRSLSELATTANYEGSAFGGRELVIPDGKGSKVAAAVVYYRAGYTPDDYPSETEWKGRTLVEHSSAIKCPDVFYHLFGAKKVQQALTQPGSLRQFCASDSEEELLASSFAGLYALGEGDDSEVVKAALDKPHDYVLKPQREGGGNNLYDNELVQALSAMTYEERGAYILMQKIVPPTTKGMLVRGGKIVYNGECVCELGVFGISLREYDSAEGGPGRILLDIVAGHILRSKSVETDEGGVAAGYAFLSSPLVV